MAKVWEFHHSQWCYSIDDRMSCGVYVSRDKAEAASRKPQHFSTHTFTTRPVHHWLQFLCGVILQPQIGSVLRETGAAACRAAGGAVLARLPSGERIKLMVIEHDVPDVPDRQVQLADGFLDLPGSRMASAQQFAVTPGDNAVRYPP